MNKAPPAAAPDSSPRRAVAGLIRGTLLWLVPAAVVWVLLTPFWNVFLRHAAQNVLHLGESPNVTRLVAADRHTVIVQRTDLDQRGSLHRIRLTDLHFHLILLLALFLGTPAVRWRDRLGNLGTATLVAACFEVVLLVFFVQFVYATQLGGWSGEHYSSAAQIFWGLGKHLLDLPFKFALPLLLWCAFYLRLLWPVSAPAGDRDGHNP